MNFAEAYKLPIGEYVEKKGKFAYLSWCYAVRFLRENYPDALWTIHENEHGLPIFSVGDSHLVKVSVTLDGKAFTQWHPILDNNNKPIKEPSTFHINTSIHRALTKAIGIATGIGLGLYAGEDLPKDENSEPDPKKPDYATVDLLIDWIDKLSAPGAKDKEGHPITVEFLKNWYEKTPAVVAEKKKLDAAMLSQANKYFGDIINIMSQAEKKAA